MLINRSKLGLVSLFLGAIAASYVILLFWGSLRVGISADEDINMKDLDELRYASDPTQTHHFAVYGLSFQILGNFFAFLFGIEPLGDVQYLADSFYVRHALVAFLALCTASAVATLVFLLTSNRIVALWAGICLLAIPVFLGHGFFNGKDIPVACGYTFVTLAATWSLRNMSLARGSKFQGAAIYLLAVLGVWLAAGVRIGMLVIVLATLGFWTALFLIGKRIRLFQCRTVNISGGAFVGGILSGLLLFWFTNPCRIAPVSSGCISGLELLPQILAINSRYTWQGSMFVAGHQVDASDPSFWYLPVTLWAGLPLLIGLFAFIGLIFFPENLSRISNFVETGLDGGVPKNKLVIWGMLVPPLLQASLVPVGAILTRSTLYDMQRQFLFVYPAICVFAGLGLFLLLGILRNSSIWIKSVRAATYVGAAVAVVFPLYEDFKLFPYNYIYVNPLASIRGYSQSWETDYLGVSLKEAFETIPSGEQFAGWWGYWVVSPFIQEEIQQGNLRLEAGEQIKVLSWHRKGHGWVGEINGCRLERTISRTLRGYTIPVSYVNSCPRTLVETSSNVTGIYDYWDVITGRPVS